MDAYNKDIIIKKQNDNNKNKLFFLHQYISLNIQNCDIKLATSSEGNWRCQLVSGETGT